MNDDEIKKSHKLLDLLCMLDREKLGHRFTTENVKSLMKLSNDEMGMIEEQEPKTGSEFADFVYSIKGFRKKWRNRFEKLLIAAHERNEKDDNVSLVIDFEDFINECPYLSLVEDAKSTKEGYVSGKWQKSDPVVGKWARKAGNAIADAFELCDKEEYEKGVAILDVFLESCDSDEFKEDMVNVDRKEKMDSCRNDILRFKKTILNGDFEKDYTPWKLEE